MNDQFCAGVNILLARMDSHPDEFSDYRSPNYHKWEQIVMDVMRYKNGHSLDRGVTKCLTDEEMEALWQQIKINERRKFDEWVMKQMLEEPSVEKQFQQAYVAAQGQMIRHGQGWKDPYAALNAMQPGGIYAATAIQTSGTVSESIVSRLKRELGIK